MNTIPESFQPPCPATLPQLIRNRDKHYASLSGWIFLLALAIAGCQSAPVITSDQIEASDIGPAPAREGAQNTIRSFMELRLKDPQSATYKFGEFTKTALRTGKTVTIGWETFVSINAKNSYGAYIGFQQYGFFFSGGEIRSYLDPEHASVDYWTPVR